MAPGAPTPLSPPVGGPPRLTEIALPAYRHVPGLTPHPVKHPEGHSHGIVEPPSAAGELDLPREWRRCEDYLHGVDLFNLAYFWEAHEAWEAAWHAVGHDSEVGQFLQGLIQTSAALLKRHLGVDRGARSLLTKASRRLDTVPLPMHGLPRYMGLALPPWREAARRYVHRETDDFPFLRLG